MCFTPRRIPKHLILEEPKRPGFLQRHWVKVIGTTTFLLLGLAISDIARADKVSEPSQLESGNLVFQQGANYVQATHLESRAQVTINGMVARLVLSQHFKNQTDQWQEAVYSFPLSETSAVNRVEMHIGARHVVARIREKTEAKKIYQAAQQAGKKAALTEQHRPNVFSQRVANIAPGESISIELHVTQPVDYKQGKFSWRLPMTLTPRYIPNPPLMLTSSEDEPTATATESTSGYELATDSFLLNAMGWGLPTPSVPDAASITPYYYPPAAATKREAMLTNPMKLSIDLNAGLPLALVSSSYHDIQLYKDGDTHHISTQTPYIAMDRDFELSWQPVANQQPEIALFTETINNENYGLLLFVPPTSRNAVASLARDITFIIDTSGSMSGPSIIQAKESLLLAISKLNASDRFNIIEFNSNFSQLFAHSASADQHNQAKARRFVNNLQASGGTEIYPPLDAALSANTDSDWLKQIVFITDGSVGNEAQLFALIHEKLANARLFTVGIGSAPNSFFMRKAAQFGRGTFTHIGDSHEVATKMQPLFDQLGATLLSQVKVQWPAGIETEIWPNRIPDLYTHEPLLLAVKFQGELADQQTVSVSGNSQNARWSRDVTVNIPTPAKAPLISPTQPKGIATLWARAKIEALLDEKVRGRKDTEVRADVLPIALRHELLSPYTSFIAVDETPEAERPQDQKLSANPVANLVPFGQTVPTIAYPKTATTAPQQTVIALTLLLLGLLLRGWRLGRTRVWRLGV
ncbi:marine proteobacterial sortase target protein [Simiduia curdlanivorans]|uniref:Marine proteobacterial sortase target protein n=1 Tax=Simiduia curdlanivorans TaxID=1492769 RepID=A0ABV8V6U4_9GAMM|nr:marine proteobacterial sortase target protein [Simiduia curdlanivorans]MDN3640514.1 marine proteobacterial sortase target protein [Simiduia curdlanivorans]